MNGKQLEIGSPFMLKIQEKPKAVNDLQNYTQHPLTTFQNLLCSPRTDYLA